MSILGWVCMQCHGPACIVGGRTIKYEEDKKIKRTVMWTWMFCFDCWLYGISRSEKGDDSAVEFLETFRKDRN